MHVWQLLALVRRCPRLLGGVSAELAAHDRCGLLHGGADAKTDVLQACRNGWEVLVLEGAGGFADVLAAIGADDDKGGEAPVVDQRFCPRIKEGEVRVQMVFDTPVGLIHKKPEEGGLSAVGGTGGGGGGAGAAVAV